MATELATFTLTDALDHTWEDELVGFAMPVEPKATWLAIADETGGLHPCQFSREADGHRVWFRVDRLPAGHQRTFRLLALDEEPELAPPPPRAIHQGKWLILENEHVAIRLPAEANEDGSFPAPILGMRGAEGWIGGGRFCLSPHLTIAQLHCRLLEEGPLWIKVRLLYEMTGGETYAVTVRLFAGGHHVEIHESSQLNRDAWLHLSFSGLSPDRMWTHRHQEVDLTERTGNLGSIQMPVYSGIWVPDDYYYAAFFSRQEDRRESLALGGIQGGVWDYPYANQIDFERDVEGNVEARLSIKAGHRAWVMAIVGRDALTQTQPAYDNPLHRLIKHYETPLDKVKDYVLTWDDVPAEQRPFAIANPAQLAATSQRARAYHKFADYVAKLDPELPGDFTYYHAGTHRTFEPDYWNDPAVLYVVANEPEERRRQAMHLKEVVLNGLAHRRRAMLAHGGHVDHDCASINLGRGLRPWAALYDFAAAEGVFTPGEERLVKATFAFFCYKIADPDFWPADALTLRDDHPRSAHRTHWFPGRQHDWAFYNIDNIPHNFHGDLWSALGCMAMVLPRHPRSDAWLDRTLDWWECELTEWVFPEGAWLESSTYTLNSMKDYLIYCRMLANRQRRDYFTDERLQRAFRFIAECLGPDDPRIGGRSLPVMGDGSYPNGFCYVLGWMAGLSRHDRDFSRLMAHAWKSTGEYLTEPGRFGLNFCDFLFIDPSLPGTPPPPAGSRHYHGLGAILRHAPGTADDIWCFIKSGIIYSHFHEPEGTFQLWWNGVPLCDEYGVQYGIGTDGIPASAPACHNCIEIDGLDTAYNKGDLTTFITSEAFDYTVAEAPILPAYLEKGQWVWGYRGEMGPAGWHRRHFFLVKPCFLYLYDELESPYRTTWHLNVKADSHSVRHPQVHYDGRLGTDLELLLLDPAGRTFTHSEYNVGPANKYGYQPPPRFYHQQQLHLANAPYQDVATVLVPHRRGVPAAVTPDAGTGGARIELAETSFRAMLFASRRTIETDELRFQGTAGAVARDGEGNLTLHLGRGNRLGVPGQLVIDGDGPYTACLGIDGKLHLHSQGVARWLTIEASLTPAATCDSQEHALDTLGTGVVRIYLPAGDHRLTVG